MTERNRVLPTGQLTAAAYRGRWMGNRGGPLSSDPDRRQWASRAWIYCRLEFNDRARVFRQPGRRYTELFFVDEAHALAAGHRPCGECQHRRLAAFKAAAGFSAGAPVRLLDDVLHRQRTGAPELQRLQSLPHGTFVLVDGATCLLWRGTAYTWSPSGGYVATDLANVDTTAVRVLTPPLARAALAAGFPISCPDLDEGAAPLPRAGDDGDA
ncbi:hypothetical protein [Cumulibacter manganitolerans]|uniref:hypothetical protein n=1 Tax=Cumulibacter manganitolerans TaxID=1884992 RepID=UPI001295B425|nr:hypothetical protein [Cumulibacter manganitolerans]